MVSSLLCPFCSHDEFTAVVVEEQSNDRRVQCKGCNGRSKLHNLVTEEEH